MPKLFSSRVGKISLRTKEVEQQTHYVIVLMLTMIILPTATAASSVVLSLTRGISHKCFFCVLQNIILFSIKIPQNPGKQQHRTLQRRVNGPHVKAHGKRIASTPGGFPHIDGEGGRRGEKRRGWGGRARFTGSQTPAELQWSSLPP